MRSARPDARIETSALYVQIPRSEAEKLDRAAFELKAHKRDLVAALVARYVDPSTSEGLDRLRTLGTPGRAAAPAEIPQPPERRAAPPEPTVRISPASDWVAGMQRSIRDFTESHDCPEPLVQVTLDDGEQLFLQALRAGPGDDFVTLTVHQRGNELTRLVVLRLDAIRKVELLREPPTSAETGFAFRPRDTTIGFASGR